MTESRTESARAEEWPDAFAALVREALPDLPAEQAVTAESRLLDSGLDSVGAVALIGGIEDLFGIVLDEELLDPDLFSTAGYLWRTVRRRADADG
ncbi:acyl carrier protein [Actinospica robiniae]|uniref:acyl carrier protein n=1 Tax=Actinospica robiniae TaxID=304901 RepID=UPI000417D16C|nr:acyl carrier protein [Actinospica robiniae]